MSSNKAFTEQGETLTANNCFISYATDGVPPDGTPQKTIHTFQLGLVIVYYLLAVAGIVFSVVCLLFNFAFRKTTYVRNIKLCTIAAYVATISLSVGGNSRGLKTSNFVLIVISYGAIPTIYLSSCERKYNRNTILWWK